MQCAMPASDVCCHIRPHMLLIPILGGVLMSIVWLPWCTNRHMMASDEVRLLSHNATYACDSDSDSAQSQLYIAHGDNFLHSFISVHITGWYGNIWVSIGEHDCRLSFVKKFDEHLFFVLTNGITQKNEDTWDLWSVNEYNGHSSSNFNKESNFIPESPLTMVKV